METIGQRLIKLRNNRGLTQRGLAESLGISHTTIARIEKEAIKPSANTIEKLAKFFLTTTDYVLNGKEKAERNNTYNIYSGSPFRSSFEYLEIIKMIDNLTRDELIMLKGILLATMPESVKNEKKSKGVI